MKLFDINHRTYDASTIFNIGLVLVTTSLWAAVLLSSEPPSDASSDTIAVIYMSGLIRLAIGCMAGMALVLVSIWLRLDQMAACQKLMLGRLLSPTTRTVVFQHEHAALPCPSQPGLMLSESYTGTKPPITGETDEYTSAMPEEVCSKAPTADQTALPRVLLPRKLLVGMSDYIHSFASERGADLEIGGMFVGEFEAATDNHPCVLNLQGFIEAGPKADCQPCSLLLDEEHLARQFEVMQLQHPRIVSSGMFHLHPGQYDCCSSGDLVADRQAVRVSTTGIMVFAIITRDNPKDDTTALRYGNLKFNFFVMSRQSGLHYQAVRPELVDAPIIQCPPALARFVGMRPDSARADWMLLRQMKGIGTVQVFEVDQGRHAGLWFTLAVKGQVESIHLCLQNDGAVRLFSGTREAPKREFRGVWNNPEVGPHIFISQLALHVLGKLRAVMPKTSAPRHYVGLLRDSHRLVAETRAMAEHYPHARLRRDGDELYWLCTICQSGRQLRIKVSYPPTYPHTPPELRVLDKIAPSPHLIGDRICWVNTYSAHCEWNPSRDSAAVAVNAAVRWYASYLVYRTLKKWPEQADD